MPIIMIGVIAGSLIAAAISALFSSGATAAQNKYNSPKAQLKRLRKAGLPLAYMYGGRVNNQSTTPQLSIDPTLGTLGKAQASKLGADTTGKDIENKKDQGEIDWLQKISPEGTTNQEYNLDIEQSTKHAERFLKQHEEELKQIELWTENKAFAEGIPIDQKREALKKAQQQVLNLIEQAGLMKQLQKIRGFEELLNESISTDLESLPDWVASIMKLVLIATKR